MFAARSVLWGGDEWAKKWGYSGEDLSDRKKAAEELLSGNLSEGTRRFLLRLDRDVVAVRPSQGFGKSRPAAYSNTTVALEWVFSAPSGRPGSGLDR